MLVHLRQQLQSPLCQPQRPRDTQRTFPPAQQPQRSILPQLLSQPQHRKIIPRSQSYNRTRLPTSKSESTISHFQRHSRTLKQHKRAQ